MTNQNFPQRVQALAVKTKECPSCAMEIDTKVSVCPICKFEFPKRSPWITWMAIILVLIWLLSYLL